MPVKKWVLWIIEKYEHDGTKKIIFVTGASGVGKTTLITHLKEKYSHVCFLHFDEIGIPSLEKMIQDHGSPEKFQQWATCQWVKKMLFQIERRVIVIEGQTDLNFIENAFKAYRFANYQIVLVDCQEGEMMRRLVKERKQPELASEDMKNWKRYLRKQADQKQVLVIETDREPPQNGLQTLEAIVQNSLRDSATFEERLNIDTQLVQHLVKSQFPRWQDLPIRPVAKKGWDNSSFRLGDKMLVRLPNALRYAASVEKEQKWLPRLALFLPVTIPKPVAIGQPDQAYPFKWSIYRWIPGKTAMESKINNVGTFASAVANFITSLHKIDTKGAPEPQNRHFAHVEGLHYYDVQTRRALEILKGQIDDKPALNIWDEALATRWANLPVWVHGDLTPANMLVHNDKVEAVIDFGCTYIGDPACDLVIAWKFLDSNGRKVFRQSLPLDKATWERGRAWAFWKALIIKATLVSSNAFEIEQAGYTIKQVFADYMLNQ